MLQYQYLLKNGKTQRQYEHHITEKLTFLIIEAKT